MSPESDDDIKRLLDALRGRPGSGSADHDLAWRLAAGEQVDDVTRRRLLADPDLLQELGIASAVLAERGRPHPEAERSADAVLARVGLLARERARAGWRRRVGGLVALAAAAVLLFALWPANASRVVWSSVDVAAGTSRGGEPDGLNFRVRIQPRQECAAVVFVVLDAGGGPEVQRLHPLRPELATSPTFAKWPRGALPGGTATILPPRTMEAYALPVDMAFLVLVTGAGLTDEEASLGPMEQTVLAALGGRVDVAALARVVAALKAKGYAAESQSLRRP
jgi:hypothetical protein